MSETYFSKLDPKEKESRLIQLGNFRGKVTIWVKGSKHKHKFNVIEYDSDRLDIVLDNKDNIFTKGSALLCSFELRGMSFFAEVVANRSIVDYLLIEFPGTLFKSEKRASYRLLTFPIYEVYAEFFFSEMYEGGKVIDLKSRTNQTQLFKNFLKLMDTDKEVKENQPVKFRVQDLSATGLSLHISEIESKFFFKDAEFSEVKILFNNETITVPEVRVVYVVPLPGAKKFKVGFNFPNIPTIIDELIGKKINELLREVDSNKDFENFTK